ncbi:MAG: CoA transferase [Saprospiraceae bacterium]|nr:CoA transferase [Saprospiraceae bacterium]
MFKDLKIVELASVLAGPLTGTFFSELGAQVIKIENKLTNGDVTRTWKLPNEPKVNAVSAYYSSANYGKESLLLDLTNESDYNLVINHIKDADIVISNFKSSTAQKLKLTYDYLSKINASLIFAELTGFGRDDPRLAFDVVLQAETGFMFMNGEPDRIPVKMPVALIDVLAAHHMKEAILVALINKMKTGEGRHIEISLYDCAMASLVNQATNWLMQGHIPQRMGTKHPNIAPYGDMFKTKDDKFIVLAIGSDKQFHDFSSILNLDAHGFETNVERLEKRELLNSTISDIIKEKDLTYWTEQLGNLPFGIVKNLEEVFQDPRANELLLKETIGGIETTRVKTALI